MGSDFFVSDPMTGVHQLISSKGTNGTDSEKGAIVFLILLFPKALKCLDIS